MKAVMVVLAWVTAAGELGVGVTSLAARRDNWPASLFAFCLAIGFVLLGRWLWRNA